MFWQMLIEWWNRWNNGCTSCKQCSCNNRYSCSNSMLPLVSSFYTWRCSCEVLGLHFIWNTVLCSTYYYYLYLLLLLLFLIRIWVEPLVLLDVVNVSGYWSYQVDLIFVSLSVLIACIQELIINLLFLSRESLKHFNTTSYIPWKISFVLVTGQKGDW
jgi:hypothetical protein